MGKPHQAPVIHIADLSGSRLKYAPFFRPETVCHQMSERTPGKILYPGRAQTHGRSRIPLEKGFGGGPAQVFLFVGKGQAISYAADIVFFVVLCQLMLSFLPPIPAGSHRKSTHPSVQSNL